MAAALVLGLALPALAGESDVIGAKARRVIPGVYDFDVTIRSNDRDGDYYTDAFDILAPDGTLLGRRELLRNHGRQQPFTAELLGVKVPGSVDRVIIRARHKTRGFDGETFTLVLPR